MFVPQKSTPSAEGYSKLPKMAVGLTRWYSADKTNHLLSKARVVQYSYSRGEGKEVGEMSGECVANGAARLSRNGTGTGQLLSLSLCSLLVAVECQQT